MLSRIVVGDIVQVMSGKDKGNRGEIVAVTKDRSKVKVRGIALRTKFEKAKDGSKTPGVIKKIEAFIHACIVMPICPETDKPCRVRTVVNSEGKKLRVSHRSGVEIRGSRG